MWLIILKFIIAFPAFAQSIIALYKLIRGQGDEEKRKQDEAKFRAVVSKPKAMDLEKLNELQNMHSELLNNPRSPT